MVNFHKRISGKRNEVICIIFLLFFSVSFNQYYGFQGINPIDSFFSFNTGYDILNGHYPFKDYWTRTGPFIDFTLAILFKIFGVSWSIYVLYASIFNFIFTIATFYILYKFGLNLYYCFLYAFLVSILAYPSAGTPYTDHQNSFLSIIAVYCFILALKTNLKIYWFVLPIIIGISFLTKQAPTGHIFLIISLLSSIHFIFNYNTEKIIYGIVGSLFFISTFLIILSIGKIPIMNFVDQYILFPISLAENRLEFIFPLEFSRVILRFKLIHLASLTLIVVCIKKTFENYKYLKSDEFLSIVALLGSTYALIVHQLMTINGIFIFFIIPILSGFSHIYYLKYFKNNKYIYFVLILLSISSTIYYGVKYIDKRDFMDLRKISMENSIDAKILDEKLSGLKWKTPLYPENPQLEISNLKEAISVIKNDNRKKIIVTDYQFISVILSTYDYSPNKYWFKHHAYPSSKDHKYFERYRNFIISKLKENKIEIIYTIKPLWGEDDVLETILSDKCVEKSTVTEILDSQLLLKCEDLEN